jgi:hypothetical protein
LAAKLYARKSRRPVAKRGLTKEDEEEASEEEMEEGLGGGSGCYINSRAHLLTHACPSIDDWLFNFSRATREEAQERTGNRGKR